MARASGQLGDLRGERGLVFGERLQVALFGTVEVRLPGALVAVEHKVQIDQQLKVFAERPLHRQPVGLVDLRAARGQVHEEVVADQVRLAETDAGVVERLEDAVDVVGCVRGHLDDL